MKEKGFNCIITSVLSDYNSSDIGPAHLEYAGWEALQRIVPGFGKLPATMEDRS